MDDRKREKELKELSQVIVDALTRNDEVMGLLADLKDRKIIDSSTLLGLALKINDLLEISGATIDQIGQNSSERSMKTEPAKHTNQDDSKDVKEVVDGRELTPLEIAFERWASEKFDEKKWLRKAGLIW